jgi:predicted transcriptional regulator
MLNALSPKRLELLRAVHETPAPSVKALAERLGRDYKRVHEDVQTLTASGLLRRENGGVSEPHDAAASAPITPRINLADLGQHWSERWSGRWESKIPLQSH